MRMRTFEISYSITQHSSGYVWKAGKLCAHAWNSSVSRMMEFLRAQARERGTQFTEEHKSLTKDETGKRFTSGKFVFVNCEDIRIEINITERI